MGNPLDTTAAIRLAAMDLLARREHGREELSRKLRRRGAEESLLGPVLDRLAEDGLLDESRYLESYIASRARAGYGPLRLREELGQRGLKREQIEAALRDADVDWQEQLEAVWRKKFGTPPADAKERAKQGRFLSYRGYAMDGINRVLSRR